MYMCVVIHVRSWYTNAGRLTIIIIIWVSRFESMGKHESHNYSPIINIF